MIAIKVWTRQTLNAVELLVAQVECDVLRNALGVVLLSERKQRADAAKYDDGEHRRDQGLNDRGLVRLRLGAADGRVDHDPHQLWDDQLRGSGDDQRTVGEQHETSVAA